MRFRQVHLDFHTSEAIEGIGSQFSKENFQEMLKLGHVDSITVFSKCHHGWSYHPTQANRTHPHLSFDLLRAQIEAAHEIGVKTPVYISAGLDEKYALDHADWLLRNADQSTTWVKDFVHPGYHTFCFNSPYLDKLMEHIAEVVENYDADGIFLDIVGVKDCYCANCTKTLLAEGKDPNNKAHVHELAERVYRNYLDRVEETIHSRKPDMPIFHNGGHIIKGRRDLATANTHLELESLPTGGWGYDHFPLSARYVQGLGMEFLGMTGKFHQSWGEFGGYKHPNALKYEVSLAAANGAKCSVGDQLSPTGKMDEATYALIGEAYSYLEQIEPWCDHVTNVADVALLSCEAILRTRPNTDVNTRTFSGDIGCVRMMLEEKILFDLIDIESDFSKYKVIILPDVARVDDRFTGKLKAFVKNGGKVLASGVSGLDENDQFQFDFGCEFAGPHGYQPTYFRPGFALKSLRNAAFVEYQEAYTVKETGGEVAGWLQRPYFNRELTHFCSHRHTPCANENTSPSIVFGGDGAYVAWNIFTDYAEVGSLYSKEVFSYVINRLLDGEKTLSTNLPAQGIATIQEQKDNYVVHLLYANPVKRGTNVEIIEDLVPIHDTSIKLRLPKAVKRAYLAPQNLEIPLAQADGALECSIDEFTCHQMIVLEK